MAEDHHLAGYGRTEITVSPLCIGTSGWDKVTATEAAAILTAASPHGINFADTSHIYAGGLSEKVLGTVLATSAVGSQSVVQTKLDRDTDTGDFGYGQMFTSVHESLDRLGTGRIPVLMLHDPQHIGFERAMKPGGPVDALIDMRQRAIADYIGISGGPVDMLQRFVETDIFDALITHNHLTLLDWSADALLSAATERDMGVSNAAPFGAGILTGDRRFAGTYAYAPISADREAAFVRLVDVCTQLDIPIGAAALQFSLRDYRVHSTVVGSAADADWNRRLPGRARRSPTMPGSASWTQFPHLLPADQLTFVPPTRERHDHPQRRIRPTRQDVHHSRERVPLRR